MKDAIWQRLHENFEIYTLLQAVDALDEARGVLADTEEGGPLQMRHDLLNLYGLAMELINEGFRSRGEEMVNLAVDLQSGINHLITLLEEVQTPLDQLLELVGDDLLSGNELED